MANDAEIAAMMVAEARRLHTSPSILFLLRLPMPTLRSTTIGTLLVALCQRLSVQLPLGPDFFREIHRLMDSIQPVTPDFFKVAYKRDNAIEEFRAELLARKRKEPQERLLYLGAHMPFCFQSLPSRSQGKIRGRNLFFVFANPEDGIRTIHRILFDGGYRFGDAFHHFTQVYEIAPDVAIDPSLSEEDNRLAYMFLDWEVYESRVNGRLSHAELRELCLAFPDWFCGELYRCRSAIGAT
jgi:hypothetical protein